MFWPKIDKIGGKNIIVEAMKVNLAKKKYHRGHLVKKVWVLGLVERTVERKILFFIVKKRNIPTIDNVFRKLVKAEAIVHNDMWRGYNNLNWLGFRRKTVNHNIQFVNYENNVHTNTIEGNWSSCKEFIEKRHRTEKSIGFYLIMIMIKRNFNMHPYEFFIKNLK